MRASATRLLAMEPLREDIHRAVMRAYVAQGRVNLALKQYEHCRDALQRELKLQPEPETRHLHEEVRMRRMAPQAARMAASAQVRDSERPAFEGDCLRPSTNRPGSTSPIRSPATGRSTWSMCRDGSPTWTTPGPRHGFRVFCAGSALSRA
ncbi:bacterial transcriptional activator domain-containing protein [Mesorhizobium sp. M0579]|uniref:bacterial transcriptional activator domain-containing protein n=1 Tax=Mesorhizobium sp. M0579 TaxID=2956962 RepID=UPI003339D0C6